MKYAYTNEQVRSAEERAFAEGTSVSELMERAGRALADAVRAAMRRLNIGDCLFVCGGGNNGGDGFVAARLLAEEGEDVSVLCLAEKFTEACRAAKERFKGELLCRPPRRRYALIADCILGTGLHGEPSGETALLIDFVNSSGAYVVACDLPSGLAENGVAARACVRADETVCLGALKCALLMCDGADAAGTVKTAPIGLSMEAGAQIWEEEDIRAFFPKRKSNSNKGSYGNACIFAGGALGGAAFLAAKACLKSGAGYTRLSVTSQYYPHVVGRLPACILKEFQAVDGELLACDCIAVGMGSGVSERLYAYLVELLTAYTGTLVLDADALNTLARYGADVLAERKCAVILTPHPGEFSRLSGVSVREVLADARALADAYAKKYGVVVVLKNNRTYITDGTRAALNLTGSPALAKGGSGDTLAGFLAGTCARGVPPFEAAVCSCYLLGKAGEEAARRFGEYAPDAEDVIECLPSVMKNL